MSRRFDTISFLSDYGTADEFVGVVKSVVRDIAPHALVIDLIHDVAPFDVRAGSLALARCVPYLPEGVVLAVVDPGVGSARRAVAIEVAGGRGVFVGPDNGLLAGGVALAGGAERAVELTSVEFQLAAPGATFAGRDVFAPAAAHLCNGVDLGELGPEVDLDGLLPGVVPLPREEGDALVGEVLWVDHFGNCQLNVGPDEIAQWGDRIRVAWGDTVRSAVVVPNFAAIGSGRVGLVVDSYGMLSVALDRSSASAELGLGAGDVVTLSAGDTGTPVAMGERR